MKRFRLYHPGDLLAAVMPCVGLLGQARLCPFPSTARRPRHRRSATDGPISCSAARRAPAVPKPPDTHPDETPKPQHLVSARKYPR